MACRLARSAGVLPHPARWDELWRSGSPTGCIPRVEPAPDERVVLPNDAYVFLLQDYCKSETRWHRLVALCHAREVTQAADFSRLFYRSMPIDERFGSEQGEQASIGRATGRAPVSQSVGRGRRAVRVVCVPVVLSPAPEEPVLTDNAGTARLTRREAPTADTHTDRRLVASSCSVAPLSALVSGTSTPHRWCNVRAGQRKGAGGRHAGGLGTVSGDRKILI